MKNNIGVEIPTILLPNEKVDLSKWSVVACDQYTSQPEYWQEVEEIVGDSPSTLKVTLPEVYLEHSDVDDRIKTINNTMTKYIQENILVEQKPGFIYLDRRTSHAESRKGLIIAIDLERYDYNKGSQTSVRATEGTVIERIPPRVKVRTNADIELPHVMLLIDDIEGTVIEPIAKNIDKYKNVYDFEMMMNGGHAKGYKIDDEETLKNIVAALEKLADANTFKNKYGVGDDKGVLLFAVGDGNHSLASAKAHWENVKKNLSQEQLQNHPARFALVEIVNVHDKGLEFEPIHRVVFNINVENILDSAAKYYKDNDSNAEYKTFKSKEEMNAEVKKYAGSNDKHIISFIAKDTFGVLVVSNPKHTLEVGTLQTFLDNYMKANTQMKIDYIHGDDVVNNIATKENNIGFFLPPMNKNDLFKTVILDGALPRKTFSMGEAEEKRFYLESRKIR